MLIGRFLLIIFIYSTFIFAAITTNNKHLIPSSSTITNEKSPGLTKLLVVPSQSLSLAANKNECQEPCSIDYCLKYTTINKNCTKLIRDQCDCCTVCLRTENQICGGHLNVYGLCEQNFICYKSNNFTEQTGICVKGKRRRRRFLIYVNRFHFV
jgi:hypothetical protein